MATFDASKIRAVALELQERTLDLYAGILPLQVTLSGWTLNGFDPALPAPFDVRVQLEAYDAINKAALRLTEWITAIKLAQPADTIVSAPPIGGYSGVLSFDNLCFEHINF